MENAAERVIEREVARENYEGGGLYNNGFNNGGFNRGGLGGYNNYDGIGRQNNFGRGVGQYDNYRGGGFGGVGGGRGFDRKYKAISLD